MNEKNRERWVELVDKDCTAESTRFVLDLITAIIVRQLNSLILEEQKLFKEQINWLILL